VLFTFLFQLKQYARWLVNAATRVAALCAATTPCCAYLVARHCGLRLPRLAVGTLAAGAVCHNVADSLFGKFLHIKQLLLNVNRLCHRLAV
jgi:hypothetical protein